MEKNPIKQNNDVLCFELENTTADFVSTQMRTLLIFYHHYLWTRYSYKISQLTHSIYEFKLNSEFVFKKMSTEIYYFFFQLRAMKKVPPIDLKSLWTMNIKFQYGDLLHCYFYTHIYDVYTLTCHTVIYACTWMYNDIDVCVRVCSKARMWELLEQQKKRSKIRERLSACELISQVHFK